MANACSWCSTGSSNTWVGADKSYVKTSTSKSTGKSVVSFAVVSKGLSQLSPLHPSQTVSYGSGTFSGTECACILPTPTPLIRIPDVAPQQTPTRSRSAPSS